MQSMEVEGILILQSIMVAYTVPTNPITTQKMVHSEPDANIVTPLQPSKPSIVTILQMDAVETLISGKLLSLIL